MSTKIIKPAVNRTGDLTRLRKSSYSQLTCVGLGRKGGQVVIGDTKTPGSVITVTPDSLGVLLKQIKAEAYNL